MKYVRFQSLQPCWGTPSCLGIFKVSGQLSRSDEIAPHDDEALQRCFDWFNMHLKFPDVFDRDQNYRAICWFKDTAREPLKRIWLMKHILEDYGYWVDVLKSERPGQIIYEDGWQVVAKPWRNKR